MSLLRSSLRLARLFSLVLFGMIVGGEVEIAAVEATPDEMATTRRWVAAKLEASTDDAPRQPGLVVLANHDPVL
jgi:hypothetical protein